MVHSCTTSSLKVVEVEERFTFYLLCRLSSHSVAKGHFLLCFVSFVPWSMLKKMKILGAVSVLNKSSQS